MEKYNIGDLWWTHFPFSDKDEYKRRPALVIGDDTIAILTIYVTSQNKEDNPIKYTIINYTSYYLIQFLKICYNKVLKLMEIHIDGWPFRKWKKMKE